MYHYLKWAALSLFFKRNIRYLILIVISLIGIYGADAVYTDLVDYFVVTDRKDSLLYLLIGKWVTIAIMVLLLIVSIMRLGFSKKEGKRYEKSGEKKPVVSQPSDNIMKRLEKFRGDKKLRNRAEMALEKRGSIKKETQKEK